MVTKNEKNKNATDEKKRKNGRKKSARRLTTQEADGSEQPTRRFPYLLPSSAMALLSHECGGNP